MEKRGGYREKDDRVGVVEENFPPSPPSLPHYLPIGRLDIDPLVGVARALAVPDQDDAVGLGDLVGEGAGCEGGREGRSVRWRMVKW